MAAAKRFWLAIVLAIAGVVALVFGILAATIWQPAQHISASADPDEPFVMVREGVLGLYGDEVTVTLTADDPDDYVWIASGLGPDVSAWLHGHDFNVITGTESTTQLAMEKQGVGTTQSGDEQSGTETSQSDAESAQSEDISEDTSTEDTTEAQSGEASQSGAEPPVSPIQSDMWSKMREGKGELTVPSSGEDLSSVLLISGNGTDPAPEVTLTWEYPRPNVAAWILFPVAGVFILLSIAVAIAVGARTRRLNKAKKSLSARAAADETATGAVPIEDVKSKLKPASEELSDEIPESEEPPAELSDELQNFAPPAENDTAVVTDDAEPPLPEQEASQAHEKTEGADERTELVTTESGMMNLAALQGGGRFPTRRALRDARARGVEKLVVEGVDYSTTSTPQPPKSETPLSETTIPTTSIKWRSKKGAAKFGSGKPKDQK